MKNDEGHMRFLADVCTHDVEILVEKEAKYKGSWKKRGGIGAFMNLARKWDRIESQLKEGDIHKNVFAYDIFTLCQKDKDFRENEIGDLRRYLMLVEAELLNLEKIYPEFSPEIKSRGAPSFIKEAIEQNMESSGVSCQCQDQCDGKCRCCGLFADECFCSAHEGECNSQFVKKEDKSASDSSAMDPRM